MKRKEDEGLLHDLIMSSVGDNLEESWPQTDPRLTILHRQPLPRAKTH
jgi:hypothetical protein